MAKGLRTASKRRHPSSRRKPKAAPATAAPDPLDAVIDAITRGLAIKIDPAWKPAIRANLQVTLRLGTMVTAVTLPDDAEPGPVFRS
jgi:hypothetical protein